MKQFFIAILTTITFCNVAAQSVDSTAKYIWKNETTTISAAVEIYGLQASNKSFCIFYINNVDTVYNSISDSLFNEFVNISTLQCPVIKVSFYNLLDTVPTQKIKLYAEELSKYVMSDVQKKYPQIRTSNSIISGVDYFAVVALFAAINNPVKINKTALFFNDEENASLLSFVNNADAKKLKGKVYVYVNHQNIEDDLVDSLTTSIGLNSSIVLYRFDHLGEQVSPTLFEEAYNWLLADGNNYIIRSQD